MKGAKSGAKGRNADKLSVKTKAGKKAAKDPNKPKRPPSAFFVFMEEFRAEFKAKNPNNKSVAAVGKAAGERWKSLSEADKAPYVEKAEKRKKDYEKNMATYNKKLAAGGDDDSDKSRSEVNDEEGSGDDDEDEDDE